jgi:hypothetical protein
MTMDVINVALAARDIVHGSGQEHSSATLGQLMFNIRRAKWTWLSSQVILRQLNSLLTAAYKNIKTIKYLFGCLEALIMS